MSQNNIGSDIKELDPTIKDYFDFFRLKLSIPQAMPFLAGAFIADKYVLFKPKYIIKLLIGFLPVLLTSISGCLLNDYSDYDNDILNPKKSDKPLIKGVFKKESALKLGIFFVVVSIIISLLFNNIYYFLLVILGIFLSISYCYLKEKPPFDFIIDSLLLPVPMMAGYYFINDKKSINKIKPFPFELFISLFIVCIIVYLHGAIWDFSVDNNSTVKTIGLKYSWILYLLSTILFCLIPKHKLFVSKLALLLLNTYFIILLKKQEWKKYTYALILFGVIYFANIMVSF